MAGGIVGSLASGVEMSFLGRKKAIILENIFAASGLANHGIYPFISCIDSWKDLGWLQLWFTFCYYSNLHWWDLPTSNQDFDKQYSFYMFLPWSSHNISYWRSNSMAYSTHNSNVYSHLNNHIDCIHCWVTYLAFVPEKTGRSWKGDANFEGKSHCGIKRNKLYQGVLKQGTCMKKIIVYVKGIMSKTD